MSWIHFQTDSCGCIVFVEGEGLARLGQRVEDWIGKNVGLSRDPIRYYARRVLSGEKSVQFVERVRGIVWWVLFRRHAQGGIDGIAREDEGYGRRGKRLTNPLDPGDVLTAPKGDYRIGRLLGTGGRGTVFRATCIRTRGGAIGSLKPGSSVVVKTVRIDPDRSPSDIRAHVDRVTKSLQAESRAHRRLRGLDCVPELYDFGTFEHTLRSQYATTEDRIDLPFVAQEYIDGDRLDVFLRRVYGRDGEFCGIADAGEWFRLAQTIAKTLNTIHQTHVTHRDIWVQNILVTGGGERVFFIDFGESAFRQDDVIDRASDKHPYLAPERRCDRVWPSRRPDVFSIGGTFFYMATGREPPPPDLDDDVTKINVETLIREHNPTLVKSNPGVIDIVCRCLRFDPDRRTRDLDRVLQDLEVFSPSAEASSLCQHTKELAESLASCNDRAHPLLKSLLEHIVIRVCHKANDIVSGLVDSDGGHDENVLTLCILARSLGREDELIDVTIPEFWWGENIGINSRFVTMNRMLARRGVRIRRVFVVTREDLSSESFIAIAKTHRDIAHEGANVAVRVQVVSPEEKLRCCRCDEHKIAFIRAESALTCVPVYRDHHALDMIRVRTYEGHPKFLKNAMMTRFSRGKDISRFVRDQ